MSRGILVSIVRTKIGWGEHQHVMVMENRDPQPKHKKRSSSQRTSMVWCDQTQVQRGGCPDRELVRNPTVYSTSRSCMRGTPMLGMTLMRCWNPPRVKRGEGKGNPLQYSCLENPMDGGSWWAAVHGISKSRTWLRDFTFMHWRRKWQPTPVFLSGESQGQGSLVGCRLWGRTESDTTEAT